MNILNSKNSRVHITLLLIIIITTLLYLIFIKPNYYRFNGGKIYFEPVNAERMRYVETDDIYAHGDYLYISSTDGLKKIDYDGNSIWDEVFSIRSPKLITNDEYMVVIDVLGYNAVAFDSDGEIYEVPFNHKILGANISKYGAIAYMLEDEDRHIIKLYNSTGELISETFTKFQNDGYPVEVELSSTGENLITSYIIPDSTKLTSRVSVFNFGQKGLEASPEKIIAGMTYEDSFASEIEFFDDHHFVVLCDNILVFYELEDSVKELKRVEIKNTINKIAFNDQSLVVLYGDKTDQTSKIESNTIEVYNQLGKKKDSYILEEYICEIIAEGKYYYLVKENGLECYNQNNRIWTCDIQKEIDKIYKINEREFLIVNKYGYEIIRIKEI